MNKKSILLTASPCVHFVQLSHLTEGLAEHAFIVAGTYDKKPNFMPGEHYERLPDFNRTNVHRSIFWLIKCFKILRKYRPGLVVTTGAAPGLVMMIVAKLVRI